MEYYVVVVGLNALLFLFLFKIILAIFAAIEVFVLIHSYALYKEYSCQDSAMNAVYTTVNTVVTSDNDPPSVSAKQKL